MTITCIESFTMKLDNISIEKVSRAWGQNEAAVSEVQILVTQYRFGLQLIYSYWFTMTLPLLNLGYF